MLLITCKECGAQSVNGYTHNLGCGTLNFDLARANTLQSLHEPPPPVVPALGHVLVVAPPRSLEASAAAHLPDAALTAIVEQLDLVLEGDRDPWLYLGPLLVSLIEVALDAPHSPELIERARTTRDALTQVMVRRARGGSTDVERWCTSITRQMRGEGT